ncbi:MAG: AAA family ATPase [Proteobacteria bacterium]|nr:AAA family ATPase [Pseudomonadota bacterium]
MPAPLFGHAPAQQNLANLLENNRFPHALLFHGPRGIGKRLLAEHLAHRLIIGKDYDFPLNPNPESRIPSSVLAAQIAAGSCPDYHILTAEDGKKSISIKQVRELLEVLQRSADTARTLIVDALEDLTPEAANTLLKTLEEPRPGIYFMLISHQLSAVLPTIRSRCRLLPLQPLTTPQVEQVLVSQHQNPSLAPLAHGAPGLLLGEGAEARRKLLEALAQNQSIPLNTQGLLPTLLQYLADQPANLATAQTYARIAQLLAKQQQINLPQALVNEAALAHLPRT